MDDVTRHTFEFCLNKWVKNSLLFKDRQKWFRGLKDELSEIPKLEAEIKALSLETDLRLQSLLLDADFNTDEVFELMRLPSTAIDIIDADGGLIEWKQSKRSCQR
jgi:hypothetical protein